MKKECSIVRDVLPLYLENMLSEDTKVFVEEHLESCSDCAKVLECLKSGRQIEVSDTPHRKHDADVIRAVKRKIVKTIFKAVAAVCLVFAVLFCAVLLYTGISHPVTKDNISLSTKTDSEYSYIILETEAGKSLRFNSRTEDILNDRNEVCGQRIILYDLEYRNNIQHTDTGGFMSWGRFLHDEEPYMEVVLELEDDVMQISNAEYVQNGG